MTQNIWINTTIITEKIDGKEVTGTKYEIEKLKKELAEKRTQEYVEQYQAKYGKSFLVPSGY